MSHWPVVPAVEYPESDGQPMGETELHIRWLIRIRDQLCYRYRGQPVYVGSNLLLYYEQGQPNRVVVPDAFVVLDCSPLMRRTFKTWEECRVPEFVLEVTSSSTRTIDEQTKPETYERIGVREYVLYDPSGDYLDPPLRGFRLNREHKFVPLDFSSDGDLVVESLGLVLSLDGFDLVLRDRRTGQLLPTEAEAERARADTERAARLAAEARVAELEAELRQLPRR